MLYEAAELCEATAVSYQEEEANRSMPDMKMNTNGAGDKEWKYRPVMVLPVLAMQWNGWFAVCRILVEC